MPTPKVDELPVMISVSKKLDKLEADARKRVLRWLNEKYSADPAQL